MTYIATRYSYYSYFLSVIFIPRSECDAKWCKHVHMQQIIRAKQPATDAFSYERQRRKYIALISQSERHGLYA